MGTWDSGTFDNDTALDFVYFISESGYDFTVVRDALMQVEQLAEDEYLEEFLSCNALVAAEIICALKGKPISTMPEDLLAQFPAWENELQQTDSILASRVVQRILNNSELRDLWFEGNAIDDHFADEWVENVNDVLTRLK